MKKVSILLLTIDRYHLTREYVGNALKYAGYPFELCHTDNGSKKEPEVIDLVNEWNPKVQILNDYNAGTTQSLNKMIELNPSDYYVFIGNDIELPHNWLKILVQHGELIPNSGVVGIDWRGVNKDIKILNGIEVIHTENTFGTMFISQKLRDNLGKFCEEYGTYGLWDSDYSIRAKLAGFENYYIKGIKSIHHGSDVGENTEYRKMKDESLTKSKPIFDKNVELYHKNQKLKQ